MSNKFEKVIQTCIDNWIDELVETDESVTRACCSFPVNMPIEQEFVIDELVKKLSDNAKGLYTIKKTKYTNTWGLELETDVVITMKIERGLSWMNNTVKQTLREFLTIYNSQKSQLWSIPSIMLINHLPVFVTAHLEFIMEHMNNNSSGLYSLEPPDPNKPYPKELSTKTFIELHIHSPYQLARMKEFK